MSDTLVSTVHIGVGIDTARYGHYAAFLGEDRQNYFNAVVPPIIQSSNFAFPSLEQFRQELQLMKNRIDNNHEEIFNTMNPSVEVSFWNCIGKGLAQPQAGSWAVSLDR